MNEKTDHKICLVVVKVNPTFPLHPYPTLYFPKPAIFHRNYKQIKAQPLEMIEVSLPSSEETPSVGVAFLVFILSAP